jgi:hypothetical protein
MTESDRAETGLARSAPCEPQRCGRSPACEPLDATSTRHCAAHSDRPAVDQHLVGLSNRRCGAALHDRPRAKPARASERDGFHPASSRHCAVRTVGRLGLPLVARAPAFSQYVLHAVHHAGWLTNSGRPSETLLGAELHTGDGLVSLPSPGTEGADLDG